MLTQDQERQLRIAENQLEQTSLMYNDAQKKLDSYANTLNQISANYNNYTPEQKAKIAALLPEVSQKYNDLKAKKEQYFMSQYEARQQIDYYNRLNAQQVAPTNLGTRRRVTRTPSYRNPTPTPTPTPTPNVNPNQGGNPNPELERYDNTDIANRFFGEGNYQKISTYDWDYFRNWWTTIYPNGGVSFEADPYAGQVPESFNLYNNYYSYKADPDNGMHYLNYLHQTMPNYYKDVDEAGRLRLRARMVRDGLLPWQADEFMEDWAESFTP